MVEEVLGVRGSGGGGSMLAPAGAASVWQALPLYISKNNRTASVWVQGSQRWSDWSGMSS